MLILNINQISITVPNDKIVLIDTKGCHNKNRILLKFKKLVYAKG